MPVNLIPGEFSPFTIAVAVLSGFIVFFGYISMFLKERLFLSEAFVALLVGIIAGPLVSGGINPYVWDDNDEITKQLTRCIIAIQVMAVGIELPKHYLKKEWLTMFILLFPVMLFMWLISGLFIYLLLESLVIAACICPTDPILANSVVKGRFAEKHVPSHIRNALSAESGANDGLGFPFLFLAIFLLGEDSVGVAIGKWVYETCLFQIALSCIIGVVVGYVARKLLQWSERHHLIDKPSFLSFAIALSLFLMSMTGFSGSDDVLACFAAGNAFSWDDWFRKETEEAHFQDVIDMMLNLAIFVYIGAIIPWWSFHDPALGLTPWRLVVIAILILLFRRLPVVILFKPVMPAMKTYREAVFSGWFGPMGVGAVFLSKIAKEEMEQVYPTAEGQPLPVATQLINPIVLFIVMSSVFIHGTTIPLFKLGKRIRSRTLSFASTSS
ncbi:Cation/H+ exchanger, partial [Circinella umbellata]